ncbi:MAG: shikimate kinase [Thermodesulfobacteriota bacterium]
MNVVLTGFMGTGKSSVGRRLAERLALEFVDTDDLIEDAAGMSVKEIFAGLGEPRFRELEKEAIKKAVSTMDGVVLSTGGGAVVDEENRRALKGWGTVVCLTAPVEVIVERIGPGDERPLLSGESREEAVGRLLKEREPVYGQAELVLDTGDKGIEEVAGRIESFLSGAKIAGDAAADAGDRSGKEG